ncbi:MAG: site-specific integrase [Firmicutes bacterium]|nr:site-specific integrase [Bacillota bacterium]
MRGRVCKYKGRKGDTYYIVYDLPRDPVTGERRQKKVSGFNTKKEAEAELARLVNQSVGGIYIEPSELDVGSYLESWLETYGRSNLASSTFESYQNIINKHLKPRIGGIPLQKLQPVHLQVYYSKCLAGGRVDNKKSAGLALSPTTVLFHHRVIREALHHAMRLGLVDRNVADAAIPPRKAKKEMQVLPEEDIQKLLDLFRGSYLYMPVYLAVLTGMRAGEILALSWRNVDLKSGTINITQSLRQRKVGHPEFQQPKTAGSRRAVEISPMVVKALKDHKVLQAKEKLASGSYKDYSLVCALPDGGPIHPGTLASRFYAVTRKAGISLRFHDLRHCHATFLLKAGVNPKIVAERLGHSSIRLTLDTYSHVVPGMQRKAALELEERLFGRK